MTHEHLNDEQLSAYLDGEPVDPSTPTTADDVLAAEMASCGRCRQRLAALGQARAFGRIPVTPVAPSVKAAAVETAISDAFPAATAGGSSPWPPPAAHRGASPSRAPRALVGAAAAVVALALAAGIPLALSQGGSHATNSASATHSANRRAPQKALSLPSSASSQPSPSSATAIPDLGSIATPAILRSRLLPALAFGRSSLDAPSTTYPPSTGSVQNQNAQVGGTSTFAAGAGSPTISACQAVAHRRAGTAHPIALVATATYARTPALIVVVDVTATSTSANQHVAVVVARSDCRVLASTTF